MLLRLPPEILHAIIESIGGQTTLQCLRLVCRFLYNQSDPFFYKYIHIVDGPIAIERQLTNLYRKAVMLDVRRSSLVKHLSLTLRAVPFTGTLQPALGLTLRRLNNLRTFELHYHHTCYIKKPCPFLTVFSSELGSTRLTSLVWNHFDDFPDMVVAMLQRQPHLNHLEIPWHRTPIRLPHTALPYLHILDSTTESALSILPGRQITHLKMRNGDLPLPFELGPAVLVALQRVRVMCITDGVWVATIATRSLDLRLECLELSLQMLCIAALRIHIFSLNTPHLRFLRLIGEHYMDRELMSEVMLQCFAGQPSLEWVDVQSMSSRSGRVFGRFTRNDHEPVKVVVSEDWQWFRDWDLGYAEHLEWNDGEAIWYSPDIYPFEFTENPSWL